MPIIILVNQSFLKLAWKLAALKRIRFLDRRKVIKKRNKPQLCAVAKIILWIAHYSAMVLSTIPWASSQIDFKCASPLKLSA